MPTEVLHHRNIQSALQALQRILSSQPSPEPVSLQLNAGQVFTIIQTQSKSSSVYSIECMCHFQATQNKLYIRIWNNLNTHIWIYINIYSYIWIYINIYMNIMNTHQILYEFPTTHHRKADGPLSWPWKSFVLFRRRCWRCAQPSLRPGCWGNRNSGKSRKASAKRVNQGQPVIDVNVNDMLPISPHHCFWYNGRPTCKGHTEGDRMRRGTQAWQWWAEILSLKAGPAGLIFDQS